MGILGELQGVNARGSDGNAKPATHSSYFDDGVLVAVAERLRRHPLGA
jgi:hypothetical protein